MPDDAELLRRYAADGAEEAFAELVRRHLPFVYAAALRQVGGDGALAQDVAQGVFTDLARKAAKLSRHRVLAGWLFTSTRYAAAKTVRGERRRRIREQEAHTMHELNDEPAADADWAEVRPIIDEAMAVLGQNDREAVLLRFFEGRAFPEIGARFSITADAARLRVERALEKMHRGLARHGVKSTPAALALALASQAAVAVPAGVAESIATTAVAGASAGLGAATGLFLMTTLKAVTGITAMIALVAGTMLFVGQRPKPFTVKPSMSGHASVAAQGAPSLLRPEQAEQRAAPPEKDYTKELVPLNELKNTGWDTPSSALATVFWAAEAGDTAVVARSLYIRESDRVKLRQYWEKLTPESKILYPDYESLVTTAVAYALPSGARAIRTGEATQDLLGRTTLKYDQHLRGIDLVRATDAAMQLTIDGWKFIVGMAMLDVFKDPEQRMREQKAHEQRAREQQKAIEERRRRELPAASPSPQNGTQSKP